MDVIGCDRHRYHGGQYIRQFRPLIILWYEYIIVFACINVNSSDGLVV